MNRHRAAIGLAPAGFTLIELIAVLSLVAVLSLTALPALNAVTNARHAGLARDVEQHLCRARSYAIASARPAGIEFDLAAQTLRLVEIVSEGAAPTAVTLIGTSDLGATSVARQFPGA
ncbi:MAG: prepilin-type N-terminal cleavage/methylation domain-containing protein, partial [Phycisphaerales bacterium]|nr:prepilin-type N-terminal cleavage/methylation domain-containing protein [Phycisphaerales bacterium]